MSVRIIPQIYLVTIWPQEMLEGDEASDAASFSIQVERRKGDRWVLKRGLGYGGNGPYLMEDDSWGFAGVHGEPAYFSRDEALGRAKELAARISMMGMTAAECLAWHKAGCPR